MMTKQEVIDLIRDAGFGYLATLEGKQPRVRPMMPYFTDEGLFLIALLGRSRSIKQIENHPQVEICFVDRKMWYCRIAGLAKISNNREHKEILWNNIPMLRQYFGGIDDPNFHMAEMTVKEVEAMTPHQKTPEFIDIR